jgi:hypothetical protein
MGLLDSLNPLSALSTVAKDLADSVLPANLKVLADGLAAGVDVASGNIAKLPQDLADLAQDLSHRAGAGASHAPDGGASAPTSRSETLADPGAPPVRARSHAAAGTAAISARAQEASAETSPSRAERRARLTSTEASPTVASAATNAPAAASDADRITAGALGGPGSEAAAPASVSPPGASRAPTAGPIGADGPNTTATNTAAGADAFFKLSDADLMNAVRDGKLPDAVKNDPAAMQRLQLRMNDISEMNQLISQMMAALHDMNRAVIQNIRA